MIVAMRIEDDNVTRMVNRIAAAAGRNLGKCHIDLFCEFKQRRPFAHHPDKSLGKERDIFT